MALLLIVGTDSALIEGTSQTLTAAGHQLLYSPNLSEALDAVRDSRPIVVLVERSAIDEIRMTLRVPLARVEPFSFSMVKIQRPAPDARSRAAAHSLSLELPLESKRLLAWCVTWRTRAQIVGRDSASDGNPPATRIVTPMWRQTSQPADHHFLPKAG